MGGGWRRQNLSASSAVPVNMSLQQQQQLSDSQPLSESARRNDVNYNIYASPSLFGSGCISRGVTPLVHRRAILLIVRPPNLPRRERERANTREQKKKKGSVPQ